MALFWFLLSIEARLKDHRSGAVRVVLDDVQEESQYRRAGGVVGFDGSVQVLEGEPDLGVDVLHSGVGENIGGIIARTDLLSVEKARDLAVL